MIPELLTDKQNSGVCEFRFDYEIAEKNRFFQKLLSLKMKRDDSDHPFSERGAA